jgi:hypothetical protein
MIRPKVRAPISAERTRPRIGRRASGRLRAASRAPAASLRDGLRPPWARPSAVLCAPLSVRRLAVCIAVRGAAEVPTEVLSVFGRAIRGALPYTESCGSCPLGTPWTAFGSRGSQVQILSPRPPPTCTDTARSRWANPRRGPLRLSPRFSASSPSPAPCPMSREISSMGRPVLGQDRHERVPQVAASLSPSRALCPESWFPPPVAADVADDAAVRLLHQEAYLAPRRGRHLSEEFFDDVARLWQGQVVPAASPDAAARLWHFHDSCGPAPDLQRPEQLVGPYARSVGVSDDRRAGRA